MLVLERVLFFFFFLYASSSGFRRGSIETAGLGAVGAVTSAVRLAEGDVTWTGKPAGQGDSRAEGEEEKPL